MPLLKRKPVLMHPLPSLSTIVQPLPTPAAAGTSTSGAESSPHASNSGPDANEQLPKDGKDDDEQLERLLGALSDPNAVGPAPRNRKSIGATNGAVASSSMPPPATPAPGYRVKNLEVFYMPETGEVFMDYEWVRK